MTRPELTAAKAERDAKILSLAGRGVPQAVIAERMGLTAPAVRRIISDAKTGKGKQ